MSKIGPLERLRLAWNTPSRFDVFFFAPTWKSSAVRTIFYIAIIVGVHWIADVNNWFYMAIGSATRVSDAQSRYAIGFLTSICIFSLFAEVLLWVFLIVRSWRNRS
jgi:hypothetical protein